ncbi:hypothetical protein D3C85_734870 [compost metagenome]
MDIATLFYIKREAKRKLLILEIIDNTTHPIWINITDNTLLIGSKRKPAIISKQLSGYISGISGTINYTIRLVNKNKGKAIANLFQVFINREYFVSDSAIVYG